MYLAIINYCLYFALVAVYVGTGHNAQPHIFMAYLFSSDTGAAITYGQCNLEAPHPSQLRGLTLSFSAPVHLHHHHLGYLLQGATQAF